MRVAANDMMRERTTTTAERQDLQEGAAVENPPPLFIYGVVRGSARREALRQALAGSGYVLYAAHVRPQCVRHSDRSVRPLIVFQH